MLGQTFETIVTNGPVSNRINIVFLSEGYTSSQVSQFRVDVTNALTGLLSHSPYSDYRRYFNTFSIFVASAQSGADHPAYGLTRNTYFNSSYDPLSDYLITIPTNSTGQGKVDALLQSLMPNCHLAVLLVNDPTSGGSDGFNKTAIASVGVTLPEILTHETGHVMAGLGDEYTTAYPGFPDIEEPNTTRQTNASAIKWNAWLGTNTPVPTPPTAEYISEVGLFQGAHYHTTNWYRPKFDCLMNHLGVPFCEVCSEALVLSFYRKVRPIDGLAPTSMNTTISSTEPLLFSVSLLQPEAYALNVQWSLDSEPLPTGANTNHVIRPESLTTGPHILTATVRDSTPLVRTDPTNLLTQKVTWYMDIAIPQLRLDSPMVLPNGHFEFHITGFAPQGFAIQTITNFSDWTSISTNPLPNGESWWTNSSSAFKETGKFFRAVTPPQ